MQRRQAMGHVMINNTRGKDDVERASLSFLVGNVALNSGQEATLLLTIEGVWVATKGYANGGRIWVCGACAKPRGITQEHLVEGAQIIGAATAVEALVSGAQTLSF